MNRKNKILSEYSKSSLFVMFLIFGLSLAAFIYSLFLKDSLKIGLSFAALILYFVPFFIVKFFRIQLPTLLEIFYYLFIFASLILGEVFAFYGPFPFWDIVLHFLSGFVFTGVGFALVHILNDGSVSKSLTMIFAFCFSITIGVLWECVEFSFDSLVRTDAQKDAHVRQISTITLQRDGGNQPVKVDDIVSTDIHLSNSETITIDEGYLDIGLMDTMKDVLVNLSGATLFLLLWPSIIKYWNFKRLPKN